MKAVILAGGFGERLKSLTRDIPKPMVTVGGKPVLEHQLACLAKYGIREIFILAGYLGEVIRDHFGDGVSFGVQLHYIQENQPLGTAGAVKQLAKTIKEDFLLVYGDIIFDIKLDDFITYHCDKKSIATIIAHPTDHPHDSDLAEVGINNRVTRILTRDNKPEYYQNLGNAALYILAPEVLDYIPEGKKTDLMHDILPAVLNDGKSVYAYRTAEYIKDMGTPDRLARVDHDYKTGRIKRLSREKKRGAVFLDRDGTLIKDTGLLHTPDELELLEGVPEAVRKLNMSDYLAIVVTNQSVIARNLCNIAGLKEIHNKLETLLGKEGAYLDAIFFCPHHPDRGFPEENPDFKVKCDCRKPAVGMIETAISKFNINREVSWMVGDTTTDIQTGVNADLKTILLRTGQGGEDGKYSVSADYKFNSLAEAVERILLP